MTKKYDPLDILSNKKVLCADDDPYILKEMTEFLEVFFEEVVAVNDGEKALEESYEGSYDALIFDVSMPKMDGLEAIKNIREDNKNIPIIVLSAHTEQEYLWRAIELKITKYLTKPYNKDSLLKALELVALELVDYNPTMNITKDIVYDFSTKQIEKNKKIIQLSKNESRLFEYFVNNNNKVVSHDLLIDYMWDYNKPSKEALKALVKELRKKIDSSIIKNIYGLGYKCEI